MGGQLPTPTALPPACRSRKGRGVSCRTANSLTHVPPRLEALGEGETRSDEASGRNCETGWGQGSKCVHPALTHT